MKELGYMVDCLTQGFRAEFNGVPVLELSTSEMRKGNPFYHGNRMYELKEYAVIEKYDVNAHLGDYYGPAGVRWSDKARSLLENAFMGEENEENEVPREDPRMPVGSVYCGTMSIPIQ